MPCSTAAAPKRPSPAHERTTFVTSEPTASAIFGSYDDTPAASNFISQYKNLTHSYFHQVSRSEARTFWAGLGAGALDVASVDVIWNGFHQAKKIADLAETFEVNCAPHNYYSHLATFIAAGASA